MLSKEELEERLLDEELRKEVEHRTWMDIQDWKDMHPDPDIPEDELIPFTDPPEEEYDAT